MARWQQLEHEVPEFAAAVRARFDAHRHALLATLRRDGAPRISGIETTFADGDLWLGMMPGSRKATDLQRDPRLALHSTSPDPPEEDPSAWAGDAKLSGGAEEITDAGRAAEVLAAMGQQEAGDPAPHVFRVDLAEVVLTRVGDPPDHLVIELWRPGAGLRRMQRA